EAQERELARVLDHAGFRNHRGDLGKAADHAAFAEDRLEPCQRIHTVLYRDDARRRPDQRSELACRLLQIPKLHRKQDDIHGANLRRIVGERDLRKMQVAERALDPQPVLLDRGAMGPAGEKDDVVSGGGKACAEIAAERAGGHDCNPHEGVSPGNGSVCIAGRGGRGNTPAEQGFAADFRLPVKEVFTASGLDLRILKKTAGLRSGHYLGRAPSQFPSPDGPAVFLGLAVLRHLARQRYRRHRRLRMATLIRALFPKRITRSPSTVADIGYFLFNVFVYAGIFGVVAVSYQFLTNAVISGLVFTFGPVTPTTLPDIVSRPIITLVLFLAYEFGYWVDHYLKHRVPV